MVEQTCPRVLAVAMASLMPLEEGNLKTCFFCSFLQESKEEKCEPVEDRVSHTVACVTQTPKWGTTPSGEVPL